MTVVLSGSNQLCGHRLRSHLCDLHSEQAGAPDEQDSSENADCSGHADAAFQPQPLHCSRYCCNSNEVGVYYNWEDVMQNLHSSYLRWPAGVKMHNLAQTSQVYGLCTLLSLNRFTWDRYGTMWGSDGLKEFKKRTPHSDTKAQVRSPGASNRHHDMASISCVRHGSSKLTEGPQATARSWPLRWSPAACPSIQWSPLPMCTFTNTPLQTKDRTLVA